ncbi:uncharacterized protein LOC120274627 [Dioscorea cayenensis subsp. rotundata]|uniref:Uncharacterized protein LOC120274627 n=1 Tax=Dioscorea cayennensis subsp. rotundata TaxID=55577 RepID=A0AB40CB25_DIOCR|nr:uncharacterized protein LOC120274627 [Dioscorea cayenensis subsp. rotundata]
MATRRKKGLCFNCDAKFVPGHKCNPPQFLCLMVYLSEDSPLLLSPPTHTEAYITPLNDPTILPTDLETDPSPSISFHALTGQLVPSTLKLSGFLNGQKVVILIDGGSTNNFIQSQLARHLGLPIQPSPQLRVTVGNGDSVDCAGTCHQVSLQLGEASFSVDLILLPIYGADIVLGVQWLSDLGPVLFDYRHLWMEFIHHGTTIRLNGLTPLQLSYISPSALTKHSLTSSVAQFCSLAVEKPDPPLHPSFGVSAPASFLSSLQHLITSYTDIFALSTTLLPPRSFDHRIPLLPHTPPVNVKPYRYPHYQKGELEHLVAKMIVDGLIQPSTSPYSAPVLLVKKCDGTWRFCVDYRNLNTVTIKDRFPIPTVDELFDELSSACVFSKLDLRAGYHQIRIYPPDIEKTAFRTHEGHYEFRVMPFSLSNAPSTFQALMNSLFKTVLRRFVVVFFDDILIYNHDWTAHLAHLRQVFSQLRLHHLFVKKEKCDFVRLELDYLGHHISGHGVAVDQVKFSIIRDWPIPKSLRNLHSFLGLT